LNIGVEWKMHRRFLGTVPTSNLQEDDQFVAFRCGRYFLVCEKPFDKQTANHAKPILSGVEKQPSGP